MGELANEPDPFAYRQIIAVRKDLKMRKGKLAAQVAHATTKLLMNKLSWTEPCHESMGDRKRFVFLLGPKEGGWLLSGKATKIVVGVEGEEELLALIDKSKEMKIPYQDIIDAGLTEFNGVPTRTCVGFGPALQEELDPLTGHLPLL